MNICVQFSSSAETTIIALFGCAQEVAVYPNQAVIATSDARYKTYFDSLPSGATQYLPTPG